MEYTPTKHKLWTNLDELGASSFSMVRYTHESLRDYRARLLLEARDPAGPTQRQFISSVSRQVALQDVPVFTISLVMEDDLPVALDPMVEITSTRLRAYNNYGEDELSVEIDFLDREDGLVLADVYDAFVGNDYFELDILDDLYEDRLSRYCRYGSTRAHRDQHLLLESRENKLPHQNIRAIYPERSPMFKVEVETLDDVLETGDFYVDYVSGIVFTKDPALGTLSYSYNEFPYTVWWSAVHAWPMNDPDRQYLHKDSVIGDDGLSTQLLLSDAGVQVVNELLEVHPLTWGE